MKLQTNGDISRIRIEMDESLYIEFVPEGINSPPNPKTVELGIGQMYLHNGRVALIINMPLSTYRNGRTFLIIDDPNRPDKMELNGMELVLVK